MIPSYDKSKRKKEYEQLPKGAYVVKIIDAKEEPNRNGSGTHLTILFDIAEGEYAGIYKRQYDNNSNVDKKWPVDGTYYLNVPDDNSQQFAWDNWNSFFADLEDSNNGFVFQGGDPRPLKGRLIGGKFRIEQRPYNDQIYESTRLHWTCVADDVRNGKAGKLPNDKLVNAAPTLRSSYPKPAPEGAFVNVPEGLDDELPFT